MSAFGTYWYFRMTVQLHRWHWAHYHLREYHDDRRASREDGMSELAMAAQLMAVGLDNLRVNAELVCSETFHEEKRTAKSNLEKCDLDESSIRCFER